MLNSIPKTARKIMIDTGNILNLHQFKINATQNPTDELTEGLKNSVSNWEQSSQKEHSSVIEICEPEVSFLPEDHESNLKVSLKIFISSLDPVVLDEAITNIFKALHTKRANSLVLAFPNRYEPGVLLEGLKKLWKVLEDLVSNNRVNNVGVSDIDTDLFVQLHSWAQVKPTIVQINLATCCTVPEPLQVFTKANDIQLLTHSDPFEILPKTALNDVFGPGGEDMFSFHWAARFQVHYKSRGVLFSKGYLVCLLRSDQ